MQTWRVFAEPVTYGINNLKMKEISTIIPNYKYQPLQVLWHAFVCTSTSDKSLILPDSLRIGTFY